jgi:hypothetical protein
MLGDKNMKKIKNQYRQGDILIEKINAIPENLRVEKGVVLAHGEATGHAHAISEPAAVKIYSPEAVAGDQQVSSEKFVHLTKASQVQHQEHAVIPLTRGKYRVTRQREYTPGAILNVAD